MKRFLYVFSNAERDEMLSLGFKLIKSDTASEIYVFENRNELCFNSNSVKAVPSDTLTF